MIYSTCINMLLHMLTFAKCSGAYTESLLSSLVKFLCLDLERVGNGLLVCCDVCLTEAILIIRTETEIFFDTNENIDDSDMVTRTCLIISEQVLPNSEKLNLKF